MPAELLLQTAPPQEFVVGIDTETLGILASKPQDLLNFLFQNDLNSPFLLKGSGFKMDMQLQTWVDGYKKALENGENLTQFNFDFIRKTISDVRGFYFEYLSKQDIFPIELEIKTKEERRVVWATHYNTELQELTKHEERDGALREGVDKAVEIICASGPNTIVILDSPKGWSGYDGVEYPDNQLYIYWIDPEGNLDAATIRTDIGLEESENLIGIDVHSSQNHERIKQIVSSPISSPADTIEVALDLIEQASGRTFNKQRKELERRKELFTLNGGAKDLIDHLESTLKNTISHLNMESIKIFVEEVGKTILDLYNFTLQPKTETINNYGMVYHSHQYGPPTPPNYYQLAYNVAKIPGCNGGGSTSTGYNTPYYSNTTEAPQYYSTITENSWHNGTCIKCKEYKWVGGCNICQPCVDTYYS